jgi:hypothetical protein
MKIFLDSIDLDRMRRGAEFAIVAPSTLQAGR